VIVRSGKLHYYQYYDCSEYLPRERRHVSVSVLAAFEALADTAAARARVGAAAAHLERPVRDGDSHWPIASAHFCLHVSTSSVCAARMQPIEHDGVAQHERPSRQ